MAEEEAANNGWGEEAAHEETAYEEEGHAEEEEAWAEEEAWETCVAIGDWAGQNPGDLSLVTGELIHILDCQTDPSGWWQGQKEDGTSGYFPSTWVSKQ